MEVFDVESVDEEEVDIAAVGAEDDEDVDELVLVIVEPFGLSVYCSVFS